MASTRKISLTAVLMIALVCLATATTYTTTVTTTTSEDEGNPGQQQQQCQRQLQGRQFRSCQRYLMQRSRSDTEEDKDVLEMMGSGNPAGQQQQSLQECCQQLKDVNEQCRCEAIKRAAQQTQQKEGQPSTGGQSKVYQKAMELPRMCNMRPQQCQIRVVFV